LVIIFIHRSVSLITDYSLFLPIVEEILKLFFFHWESPWILLVHLFLSRETLQTVAIKFIQYLLVPYLMSNLNARLSQHILIWIRLLLSEVKFGEIDISSVKNLGISPELNDLLFLTLWRLEFHRWLFKRKGNRTRFWIERIIRLSGQNRHIS
jgi:hypothetical protein